MTSRILAAALALVLGGCATLPGIGAPMTGEPLHVESRLVTDTYSVKEKVGEVQHKDAQGRSIGTSDMYQDRLVTSHHMVWHPVQGRDGIDDQDFFRIAGDTEAEEQVRQFRETGITLNRAGLGVIAASAASLIGGVVISRASGGSAIGSGMLYGGAFGFSIGSVLAYMGLGRVAPGVHPVDESRARVAAHRYNAELARAAAVRAPDERVEAAPAIVPAAEVSVPAKKVAYRRGRR
jgi:hypothetical protein